jgi:hypothetical protein
MRNKIAIIITVVIVVIEYIISFTIYFLAINKFSHNIIITKNADGVIIGIFFMIFTVMNFYIGSTSIKIHKYVLNFFNSKNYSKFA